MDQVAVAPGQLRRRIGPTLLTLYGIGVMVGAGIYVLVGTVAAGAGVLAPLAFLVAGLIAAPTALTYAELSVRIPESAGEAAYVHRATKSTAMATTVGLVIAAVGVTSSAAVLRGGIGYLTELIDLGTTELMVLLGVALTAIAVWGVLESLALAAFLTLVEVVGLILVIQAGLAAAPSDDWTAGPIGTVELGGFGLATVLAFFAFIGFEDIVNLAEEVKRPSRTLPIAIIASLAITSLLYGAVSIAAVRAVDIGLLGDSDQPLLLVYERSRQGGTTLLAGIAGAAALNGVLAQIVMAARVLYGLGRRNRWLAPFHRAHPTLRTPVRATVVVGSLALILALAADVAALAEVTAILLLAVFCAMNSALLIIKRRTPAAEFATPDWVPWLGLVGSAAGLAVALFA
ncbi:MAG: APC family permease [Actinomycetota bacterium]